MTLPKFFLLVIFIGLTTLSHAQIKAVTETGDQVLLATDGTWKYVEAVKNNDNIPLNSKAFVKPANASFLLKSKNTYAGFWLNTKAWNFEKGTDNAGEYSFSLKENSSVGAMVVVEAISMELSSLRNFAIENMQNASSKFNILNEEYRYVNGLKVLKLDCEATVQGINITYSNYYYSDSICTVQFLYYASKNLAAKYKDDGEALLNGLVMLTGKSDEAAAMEKSTTIQSSLIANSNCKPLFTGTWSYVAGGKKYMDKIEPGRMMESNTTDDKTSEYKMNWIDNCHYELIMVRSNDPISSLIKMGASMKVEIVEIDNEKMRYELQYGERRTGGEMTKEK